MWPKTRGSAGQPHSRAADTGPSACPQETHAQHQPSSTRRNGCEHITAVPAWPGDWVTGRGAAAGGSTRRAAYASSSAFLIDGTMLTSVQPLSLLARKMASTVLLTLKREDAAHCARYSATSSGRRTVRIFIPGSIVVAHVMAQRVGWIQGNSRGGHMNRDEAHAYRTARGNEYRHLTRKNKAELVAIYQHECGGLGGGNWSKEDLISRVLEHRYPLAKENEAIHVLYHTDIIWDGCEHCQAEMAVKVDG